MLGFRGVSVVMGHFEGFFDEATLISAQCSAPKDLNKLLGLEGARFLMMPRSRLQSLSI